MCLNTPSAAALIELFLGAEHIDDASENDLDALDLARNGEQDGFRCPSIYVDAFEQMVNTVYNHECHLLSEKEWDLFRAFSNLSYDARYCLVRLILRKPNTWHTLASMEKYKQEVGNEGLSRAINELCLPLNTPVKPEPVLENIGTVSVKKEPEIIDLSLDFNDENEKSTVFTNAEAGPSKWIEDDPTRLGRPNSLIKPTIYYNTVNFPEWEANFDFFCEDETCMTLSEALEKLSTERLKELIRDTKTKPRKYNKADMVFTLLDHASTQSVLEFSPNHTSREIRRSIKAESQQTELSFASHRGKRKVPRQTQECRLMEMTLKMLGKSVRVNSDLYWLVMRLNVIYERSTGYPKSLLVPSLLTAFKKRAYPEYHCSRDGTIWSSRGDLLEYIEALRLEFVLEQELELPESDRVATETPIPDSRKQFVTPSTPGPARNGTTHMSGNSTIRFTESPVYKKELGSSVAVRHKAGTKGRDKAEVKAQKAQRVKQIFDEKVFPKWKELLAIKRQQGNCVTTPGLERFEPGFVYTRMFSKAMRAMSTLREYKEEATALEALLAQKVWRRGKRGKWYERRAVLQTRHLRRFVEGPKGRIVDSSVLREAMEGIREALKDENTGTVFRPSLIQRLCDLEKKLKVPEEERYRCESELRQANSISLDAVRLFTTGKSLKSDGNGVIKNGVADTTGVRAYFSPISSKVATNGMTPADKGNKPQTEVSSDDHKWKGKSIWKGRNGEEVNIETRVLQYYESLGYKGFHSESRILTTIFALLFWDIIFVDVRGAFETPHQNAPLDLCEDSFYRTRKELIEFRLEEIKGKGRAQEIIAKHDGRHREKKTFCVGVRWDICQRHDLLEITECLDGESLSFICRLFCEDYAGRSSGVPDLIVWNAGKRLCKFVEVKGPGDRLQENQKLWVDSLLTAGMDVEICRVVDVNQPKAEKTVKSKKSKETQNQRSVGKRKRVKGSDVEMDLESQDSSYQSDELQGSRRKRRRYPDDELPTFPSRVVSPNLAPIPMPSRLGHPETPSKKQKRTSTSS